MWPAVTSLWSEPAVEDPPSPGRRDRMLAGIVVAGLAVEEVVRADVVWRPLTVAFGCGLALAVLFRRRRPLLGVALGFGGFAVLDVASSAAGADPVVLYSGTIVLVLAYALFRWGSGRDAAMGLGFMAAPPSWPR